MAFFACLGCGQPDRGSEDVGKQPNAAAWLTNHPRIEAIRRAGLPVTLAEWNAWYVDPAPAENAAELYRQAFEALIPGEPTSPSFLANNTKTLDLLHRAASRTNCRYPIDLTHGIRTELPHLGDLKSCARLLSLAAQRYARQDAMDLTAQSVVDAVRLAGSLTDEPLLISQLVRYAALAITITNLESILNRKTFGETQLATLQATFREAERGSSLDRTFAGERCSLISLYAMPPTEIAKFMDEIHGRTNELRDAPAPSARSSAQKARLLATDYDFCLARLEEVVTASALPYPECLDALRRVHDRVRQADTGLYPMACDLLEPLVRRTGDRAATSVARVRMTLAALAVERYRLAHANALPASLEQLVPGYLEAVPLDPFAGRPLGFGPASPRGFVVYSVGANRSDDGGRSRATAKKWAPVPTSRGAAETRRGGNEASLAFFSATSAPAREPLRAWFMGRSVLPS